MNTDNKSDLNQIVQEFGSHVYGGAQAGMGWSQWSQELVCLQIEALFISCLPDKKVLPHPIRANECDEKGFNDCIDQTLDNFKKRLGRK